MRRHTPKGPRSARLLGYALVVIIAGVLAGTMLDRAMDLDREAERIAFDLTVRSLRHAAMLRYLEATVEGGVGAVPALLGENPFDWVLWPAGAPRGYRGGLDDPDPAGLPGGSWYFDAGRRHVVYRVRHGEIFESVLPGPARARLQIRPQYRDLDADGRFDPVKETAYGLDVVPVEPWHWGGRDH